MGSKIGVLKIAAGRAGVSISFYQDRVEKGNKFCWVCAQWKAVELFGKDRSRSDGHDARCFQCRRNAGSNGRIPLTDMKRKARNTVNHFIRMGRIATVHSLPCFDCGNPAKEYDHYRGYAESNFFDIQAVCEKCHRKRDRIRRSS